MDYIISIFYDNYLKKLKDEKLHPCHGPLFHVLPEEPIKIRIKIRVNAFAGSIPFLIGMIVL
jgi:hypothetical protein